MKTFTLTTCSLLSTGCVAAPSGLVVVKDFDLEHYLDSRYGIARPDHRFEHGG